MISQKIQSSNNLSIPKVYQIRKHYPIVYFVCFLCYTINIFMATTRQNIAKQLKEARETKKLTQAEVAKKANLTINYYAMIERAEVNVSSDILGRIGKVLGVTIKI